jgi:hypothetical protein
MGCSLVLTALRKTLRGIIFKTSLSVMMNPVPLPDTWKDLPVWPRVSSQSSCLAAREAIVAQNPRLVVPWARDYHRFIEFSKVHQDDAVNDLRMLTDYVLPNLPDCLDEKSKATFIQLMKAISNHTLIRQKHGGTIRNPRLVEALTRHRIAARKDAVLCMASELFDHNDPIFFAAFRLEPMRFLMTEICHYSSFWQELGLRSREHNMFKGRDYLACLRAIEHRMASADDPDFVNDTERVLYPLCTDDGSLGGLDSATWSTIGNLTIIPISPVSAEEPGFRRHTMERLASQLEFEDHCSTRIFCRLLEPDSVCPSRAIPSLYSTNWLKRAADV